MARISPLALKQISNLGQCFPMFPLIPYITPNAKIEKKKKKIVELKIQINYVKKMKKFQLLSGKKSNVSNPAWASIPPGDVQLMETGLTRIRNIQREVKSQRENMELLESVNHLLVEYHPPSSTKPWGFRVPFYQRRQQSFLLYPLHRLPSQSANLLSEWGMDNGG